MKNLLRLGAGLTGIAMGMLCGLGTANAYTFDQQEVSQEKFVAIAVPLAQGNSHNLLIIEQIASDQKCWQEDSGQGVIEPLLLNFDFTGICGRSTDSNGYSIRVAGKDLGLDYKLSVKKQGNTLALVGYSYKDASAPELLIGRTMQAGDGFLKIELEPGWRFAKRAYEGKMLGHIYLTRDDFPQPTAPVKVAVQADNPSDSEAIGTSESPSGGIVPASKTSGAATEQPPRTSRRSIPISVPAPRGAKPRSVPIASPNRRSSFGNVNRSSRIGRTPSTFTTPIQIPVPQPNQPAPAHSSRQYQAPPPPSSGGLPTLSAGVLPVPNATIPLGNASNRRNVYRGLPSGAPAPADGSPPAPPVRVAYVSHRYRVVVPANTTQQGELRSLVPDAFRSTYRGRRVLQVGAYRTAEEANNMMAFLSRNGFTGILEKR